MKIFYLGVVPKLILTLLCFSTFVKDSTANRTCGIEPVFQSSGDLRVTLLVNECSSLSLSKTVILTSAWISERFNVLKVFGDIKFGADIYHSCDNQDLIDIFVGVAKNDEYNLGVIAWKPVPRKIRALGKALDVPITEVPKQWHPLVTASVGLLSALNWNDNLTVVVDDPDILKLFYSESWKEWICVKSVKMLGDIDSVDFTNPVIIFGNAEEITEAIKNINRTSSFRLLVIPIDGAQVEGLPEGTYIIQPSFVDAHQKISKAPKITPSPVLLNVAVPMISMTKNISRVLNDQCTQTQNISCLKNKLVAPKMSFITGHEILNFLKIEPLINMFVYKIYRVEHLDLFAQKENISSNDSYSSNPSHIVETFIKIGRYHLFNFTLYLDELFLEENNFTTNNANETDKSCSSDHRVCVQKCLNFKQVHSVNSNDDLLLYNIVLKQDPWVLAILSIASLGVLFTVAILIFIFVRLCKKDIFEGNPVLSVLLLFSLTIMYASVVPFALEVTSESDFRSVLSDYLCIARSLSVTLSYSCVFSLMLSRCVMLATVAYEAGFMSHITGHVQSLLCLFMVAVQGALSLQTVENCHGVFSGSAFLYALSYDLLLLGLLLCSCPFVFRSQRNYKEGGYFALSIILVGVIWIAWLGAFIFVSDYWKMTVICCGLLGTASAILGAVFIPRTYLMTSALVRDSITSALPSLAFASSTSVLDLNYSNAQHVYDCVNIATINAANSTQTIPTAVHHVNPNFYSEEPGLDDNFDGIPPCDSPDKVTRF